MTLDNTQQEIVTSSAKNIIVSAGAGSGKTRVLTERIKHLLNIGVRPDNIVAITFTNKAADEMKFRLYDVPGIGDTFIGTIHSFANKIFKNSGTIYELLTNDKRIEIMKFLISTYGKYMNMESYLQYLDLYTEVQLGFRSKESLADAFKPSELYEISVLEGQTLDEDYPTNLIQVCDQRNIISFDRLLKECTSYFASIDGELEYLLVDELQDIGNLEYNFLRALNAENNFFVGDDWQSIYRFKGGDVRIFLRLIEDPTWTTYYLNNNYRNARNILNVAKTVISQADDIIAKETVPVRDEMGIVEIASKYKLTDYLKQISESKDYKDWFILVRTNKEIVELSSMLSTLNIPYVSFKQSSNSIESIDIKMALDSVKLLTVHSAKGLESKNVILYGNFPIYQKNYLKNSDERKLMYVGITRAIDKLIILN